MKMLRSKVFLVGFCLLILGSAYYFLKSTGTIGRQFSTEINSIADFELTHAGQTFDLQFTSRKRGIYRYNVFIADANAEPGTMYYSTQGSVKLHVSIFKASSAKLYREENLHIKYRLSEPRSSTSKGTASFQTEGLDWHGNLFKIRNIPKGEQITLRVTVEEFSLDQDAIVDLRVFVIDSRPCWGIECMLD